MTDFDELLADAEGTPRETVRVPVMIAKTLVDLEFTEMPGDSWAELTARNPLRPDVVIDRNYGYNMHAVVKAAAVEHGARIDDDVAVSLTEDQWARLWPRLSGSDFTAVVDAVWGLNEWQPQQRTAAAKKAQTDALRTSPA